MKITQNIQKSIAKILNSEFDLKFKPEDIHLERPQDESYGDWATNVAMTLAKELKKNPREIADIISAKLKAQDSKLITNISVAGPGFINFKIKEDYYIENLKRILEEGENYGKSERLKGKRIMIEFAHPNPFKAFHIGHLRNIILGESLVRLLESQGAEVIRTNYQGDVGMHIAKNLWAFRKIDPKDYPETADEKVALLGKLYAQGATAFEEEEKAKEEIKEINKKIYSKEDSEINRLWKLGREWSLEKFHEIYERVYTTFEREFFESETLKYVDSALEEAKEKGILVKSEGALIFDGSKYGLDTRVFQNSQGLPTYEGKELGLAQLKTEEYGIVDLHIHNVAVEHNSFFSVTFKVKELLWPEVFKGRQYHNAYEFVGLKHGKMSSRKGNVVLGNDILNEAHERIEKVVKEKGTEENIEEIAETVGVGAVKYSFLKISPFKYLAFDLESSLNFEGDSGPYIQYTYARTRSILREVEEFSIKDSLGNQLKNKEEISVLKWLERFPEVIESASKEYTPNLICSYLFELTQRYNTFYKNHSVLKAETDEIKQARLALTQAVSIVIEKGLDLLGIKTVEKM